MTQPGSTSGAQRPTASQASPKTPQGAGARPLRTNSEAPPASAAPVGGSAEALGYLDSISEFVERARKALSTSSSDDRQRSSGGQTSARQGKERQDNEGGACSSHGEDRP